MMGVRRRLLPLALALCTLPALARPAAAYVRSVTKNSPHDPLKWPSSRETVTIYLNGFTAMTPDEVAKSIGAAAAAWGPDQVSCPAQTGDGSIGSPYLQIIPQLSTGAAAPTVDAQDSKNSIVFETSNWDEGYGVLAYTSVYKDPTGGSSKPISRSTPRQASVSTGPTSIRTSIPTTTAFRASICRP